METNKRWYEESWAISTALAVILILLVVMPCKSKRDIAAGEVCSEGAGTPCYEYVTVTKVEEVQGTLPRAFRAESWGTNKIKFFCDGPEAFELTEGADIVVEVTNETCKFQRFVIK